MEKDIVLQFAMQLRDELERSGKYRVVMTRTDDTFIPLVDRMRMARIRQAALFISIHADALKKREGDAQGATIYTLSETASDSEAARLAEDENRADVVAGIDLSHEPGDVADILIDLAQRETKAFSTQFARELVGDMKKVARLHKTPIKSAGFKVLKAPDVPAVLIELGYVSNKDDLAHLTSDAWHARTAGAIRQAIDKYFSTRFAGTTAGRERQ
jgi:N-acetylmuramoyl-L-alanine amidase